MDDVESLLPLVNPNEQFTVTGAARKCFSTMTRNKPYDWTCGFFIYVVVPLGTFCTAVINWNNSCLYAMTGLVIVDCITSFMMWGIVSYAPFDPNIDLTRDFRLRAGMAMKLFIYISLLTSVFLCRCFFRWHMFHLSIGVYSYISLHLIIIYIPEI